MQRTIEIPNYNPRMFQIKNDQPGAVQTVTVIVNEREDDPVGACFRCCFGLGIKAAKESAK